MRFYLPALAALALTACASDPLPRDAGPSDAQDVVALDAERTDLGTAPLDAGDGATADAGVVDVVALDLAADAPTVDTGADAGALEVGVDAGVMPVDAPDGGAAETGADVPVVLDVGTDVGTRDGGIDAGVDVPVDRPDAGPADGGVDVGTDTGPGVPGCTTGFGNCDGNPANGCETDLRTSATHCGGCGSVCPPGASCAAGACTGPICSAGYGNCDGLAPNGCETDTRTSAAHCGMCGHACAAGQVCVAGACVAPPCTNDAIRCTADGSGVERCAGGSWTLARVCTVTLGSSGSGSTAACYLGGCVSCAGVDGGASCGPATCDDDADCYRSGWARCIDGRCSRRGILPCSAPADCLPWITAGVTSACSADVRDLNGGTVRACTGDVVGPCTADHQCPRGYACDLRSGVCRPS